MAMSLSELAKLFLTHFQDATRHQTQEDTVQTIADAKVWMLEQMYPVGSLYINGATITNPATLLGFGTWEETAAGRAIVGRYAQGTGEWAQFKNVGSYMGALTHTLSANEMPAHSHSEHPTVWADQPGTATKFFNPVTSGANWINTETAGGRSPIGTGNTGGGAAHNNMQPSAVFCVWIRTA